MVQELGFEVMPFELAPEFEGELMEEESESGRRRSYSGVGSRGARPRSRVERPSYGTRRAGDRRPRQAILGPRRTWPSVREPYGFGREPYPGDPEPSGSERVRWIQDCLNHAMGLRLSVTGFMGPETRSAVRHFQRQQGLRVSGIVGPDTEEALKAVCAARRGRTLLGEAEVGSFGGRQQDRGVPPRSMEMELPAAFRENYRRLLEHLPPADQGRWATRRCYLLSQWDRAPRQGGVYIIVFRAPMRAGRIGYVGETGNLYKRMYVHHGNLIRLGLDPNDYSFCYFRTPEHGIIEGRLRDILNPTGLVTNQEELEAGWKFTEET